MIRWDRDAGPGIVGVDVTDRDAAFAAVRTAHEHFGRLDIVVNNAGYGQFGMLEELSEEEARAQIERYMVMPGQALAYKIGELKIFELRRKAQAALGNKFNIRDFHTVVLGSGAVPLEVLEEQVDAWIAAGGGYPSL